MGCSSSKVANSNGTPQLESPTRQVAPGKLVASASTIATTPQRSQRTNLVGVANDRNNGNNVPSPPASNATDRKKELLAWLSPFEAEPAHYLARSKDKEPKDKPDWFLESNVFRLWLDTPGNFLWLHGPRASTRYLVSKCIDRAESKKWRDPQASLNHAYVYLSHPFARDCSTTMLLRSLLAQLLQKLPTLPIEVEMLYSQRRPADTLIVGELVDALRKVIILTEHVFLAVEAIDENPHTAASLVQAVVDITSLRLNVSLIVSTDGASHVESLLLPYATSRVTLFDRKVEYNLDRHFRMRLDEDNHFRDLDPNFGDVIRKTLLPHLPTPAYATRYSLQLLSHQLDILGQSKSTDIHTTLLDLPQSLDIVYDQTLQSLNLVSAPSFVLLLQWLAHSLRPISKDEIAEIIATDSQMPTDIASILYEDGIVPVLSQLVEYSDRNQKMRLHECAKEYLTSQRILQSPSSMYHISEVSSNAAIAICCLKYLTNFSQHDVLDPEHTKARPLLAYAARFWYRHQRLVPPESPDSKMLHDMAMRFLDPKDTHNFYNSLRISRPDYTPRDPTAEDLSNTFERHGNGEFGSVVYYASSCGLTTVVAALIEQRHPVKTVAEHVPGCLYPGPLEVSVERGYTDVAELLLEADARPENWCEEAGTCLTRATRNGDVEMARLLIDYGANVNAWMKDGSTTLHCAAKEGSVELIELLADHGAKLDARSNIGTTPLHEALLGWKTEAAIALLQRGADIEAATEKSLRTDRGGGLLDLLVITSEQDSEACREIQDSTQRTPLYIAASQNNSKMVQALVACGANVDSHTSTGATPLFAATHAGYLEIILFLLQNGASVARRTESGATLLHAAAESGSADVVNLMFARRIDPTIVDDWGDTALVRAVSRSDVNVVKAFADLGCNLHEVKEATQMTLLHFAALRGDEAMVLFLLRRGLNVHARNGQGGTPLHLAANHGHTAVIKALIQNGADVNAVFLNNWTPVRLAIMGEEVKALKALLSHSPRPNLEVKDSDGYTPLQIAIHQGNFEMAELLLQHSADPNSQNNEGMTAMHAAAEDRMDLVSLLLQHGARVDIKEKHGINALARPVYKDDSTVVELLMQGQPTRDALLDALEVNGINGRIIDINDVSKLIWALVQGKEVATWMILHYGNFTANSLIQVPNASEAYPALILAVEFGHANIVKLLLRLGVDNTTCLRALYVSASKNKVEIAEALLGYGCSVDGYGGNGGTPLGLALENRHDDMVRLLCKHGANLAAEEERLNLSVVIGPKQVFYGIQHQQ